ncbi:hypothetical protein HAX54_001899 [Datura stramonium]|uniref:Uncharacterized protein n=1 Tax=Datura stramonium TaxID=4076 RepID=A0ABS8RTA2_DATST|nr:hypothetical protein [Datura stramonium]
MTCSKFHQQGHNRKVCKAGIGMPSTQPPSSNINASSSQPSSSGRSVSFTQPESSVCQDTSRIGRVQTSKSRSSSQPPTYRVSNETSTSSGVDRGKGVSGQKRGPINATRRAQKRSNNIVFGLYHDNRTGIQLGTSSERVVIAGSNIINTAPTNIDIGFKPPGVRWMGREAISTSQLQQMRNSRSENL